MAFRGRGRGRGFGGSDFKFVKPESFVLFPDIELPDRNNVPEEKDLALRNFKFRNYFQSSPYHLEETFSGEEAVDIERYSDKVNKKSRFGRCSLSDSGYLKLEPGYFPLELVRGTKFKTRRKVHWNPKRDLQKLDVLEELEKKFENEDSKGKKEKDKEGDEDEEEEENLEEEEDDVESDDDYGKGENFDDDEDDYNMSDGGDDEAAM
ncbi:DNA-directed RNA polymerase III subunit rpc31-like [Chenopodium quinoa]|uniref:DNA-directed RNA polymerase III subunit rpc31-like n=1 Tax=Chenopodium quinoa TaxID=63459 RepID=UPI000B790B1E|nr:DNA-directed RNA polymerase III subunit rpc31-like [Chenopodium quinoa]XP_021772152.1 DNA-directed RNA polymerase III subunit rpc31-like [Chenopodium quinoa]XP_021772153.1 DNA-directed RNA polymerase III subunit rpc31-like [Chenopodium quinoa]